MPQCGLYSEEKVIAPQDDLLGALPSFCVRELDGPLGTPLLGGLLFSPGLSVYTIGWLAVTRRYRRSGIGRKLIEHVYDPVEHPAEFVVTTFGPDNPKGQPARHFYERMGFHPAELAPDGPGGGARQVYRREVR